MRYLLHIGLFAVALSAVTQADAQDRRRGDRETTVVIAAGSRTQLVRPVRASVHPPRAVYDQRRSIHNTPRAMLVARRAYSEQREDLEQIVRISQRWEQATAERNRDMQWKVNRRLDAWLEREIRESIREPQNQRYTQRVRLLSDELVKLERGRYHERSYRGPGYRGYRGRGYRGHSPRNYHERTAAILRELVHLSERQVRRAEANLHYPYRLSVARR